MKIGPHPKRLALPLLISALAATGTAHAARPMITDDARVVDAKACQLESWAKRNRASTEYWALPACNFTGNLELTAGGALGDDATGTRTTDVVLQGKTLFKRLTPNGWSIGLVAGTVRHPAIQTERNAIGDLYAYSPMSFSLADDRLVLHTNLGWRREKVDNRNRLTWGLGSETRVAERTWLIAEAFGQDRGNPFYQAGVRFWIVPDRVQVDATIGNRAGTGSGERWFSFGIRLLSPAFLP